MDELCVYICDKCNYKTERKSNYNRHIQSKKHIEKISDNSEYMCNICGKNYKYLSGLSRHKIDCKSKIKNKNNKSKGKIKNDDFDDNETKNLLTEVIKQMKSLQEIVPNKFNKVNNITNNNINILNLNLFLNEKCKDALSIDEFIRKIEFVFDDLTDKTWRSKVLLNNLTSLQVEDRPFHCVNPNTYQLVLKNGSEWKEGCKEDIVLTLDNCGKHIQKNFGTKWDIENPNWVESDKKNKKYMELLKNITKEQSKDILEKEIKCVSKETYLPIDRLKSIEN